MKHRNQTRRIICLSGFSALLVAGVVFLSSCGPPTAGTNLRLSISYPESVDEGPLTGRMILVISQDDQREPRLQVGRHGPQFFGVDFENLLPGEEVVIDGSTLGYPIDQLRDLPAREYHVQALLNRYTRFDRSDGHTVWMHMDQWEGQNWRRSPGNIHSDVQRVTLNPANGESLKLEVTNIIPPIPDPEETKWVKRIKIQSELLTEFWGHPIYIGATILLPKGYDEHPNVHYPTVYYQGHFSLRAPLRFREDEPAEWLAADLPRVIAVTIQHPTPYFDDSYAVNSVNNGPYGDAIHQELIPEIEERFRTIRKKYARVLTGGSTGGWESIAVQVFNPDFYGGTWTFAPDPIDFRNVEGINIYEDKNAFFKEHEWYKVPIASERFTSGEVRLTSEQATTMEMVYGSKGRGGYQRAIWSATFGPVGEDGYFKPLFDRETGVIDQEVAQYWKENYDLRYILETNWEELGPKLEGNIHLICGHMDNYYLNGGVYYMEEFLEGTENPYYGGSVTYGERGGHGWRPYSAYDLLRRMGEHITRNAPPGENTNMWKYR
jgi:hypothetical protein